MPCTEPGATVVDEVAVERLQAAKRSMEANVEKSNISTSSPVSSESPQASPRASLLVVLRFCLCSQHLVSAKPLLPVSLFCR